MLNDFLNLPIFFLCLIAVTVSTVISVVCLFLVRRKFSWEFFKANHDVAGFLFNALGLIYAVLVAFVVYATWTDYDDAKHNVEEEANHIHDLFLISKGLPEEFQTQIKEALLKYTTDVVNVEWPLLSIGEAGPKTKGSLVDLWKIYLGIKNFKNPEQNILFEESLRKLNDLTDCRRLRILSSQSHTPAIIWTVIIIGALTSIGFSLFFGAKSLMMQTIMTSLFAMTNALIIILVLILDHPYAGADKITSEAFEYVIEFITKN